MTHRPAFILYLFIITAYLASCATIQVNKLPAPPRTPKLRVYIKPYTAAFEGKGFWVDPPDVYAEKQIAMATRYLSATGIYEIVTPGELHAVLREQKPTYFQMGQNDWALAREIGRALHADYVMIMERGNSGLSNTLYFSNILINIATGVKFGARYDFAHGGKPSRSMMKDMMLASYRDIFRDAKEDLFATALWKGSQLSEPAPVVQRPASHKPASEQWMKTFSEDRLAGLETVRVGGKGARLVVYDLDAPEYYKPAARILSEALREELFQLKQFILVNREDLESVLKEMALQQTGLIDEKEAVKTGKGLAANQVVTGKLGLLGTTLVLQAKRIDVETFVTLGIASSKFTQGKEEEMLEKLPELARNLAGMK
ncbi:MAG TPA: CsgG/HfaB family protein [Nitrospirota bacterium]|nr:CsgG/HfaB family protein [Nitrospirota bacterium]